MSGVKPFSVNLPQSASATSNVTGKPSTVQSASVQTTTQKNVSSPRTVSAQQSGLMSQILPKVEQIMGYVIPRSMQPGYSSMLEAQKPQPKQKSSGKIPLLLQGANTGLSELSGNGLAF